ncbi:kelch-like protein 11 [Oculina patagonica]
MDVTRMKQDIFIPEETQDNPFDITLVVEDGTEFKAHRKVLSEASPFFVKLLNTDMMESRKGVVRLEMLTEAGLGAVLEFIYTGHVQILNEDHARDLIEMADYLFILPLKTLAGRVLAQTLNTSNCISTYHFAERYQCKELASGAKKIIHANINVTKAEEFVNMSSEELNQWISSDEINVSAEEDVFKIILTWIDHNKSEREKYFSDLFRQVRLIYVSRDFLIKDIVTNDLVNDNACCFELVKAAVKAIDSRNSENVLFPPPRRSLETPIVIVVCTQECDPPSNHGKVNQSLPHVLCSPYKYVVQLALFTVGRPNGILSQYVVFLLLVGLSECQNFLLVGNNIFPTSRSLNPNRTPGKRYHHLIWV